tara:strand:- start:688 stop:1146 length:459 start_codon:yes stop_codon:yes gene_type:complete
MKLTIENLRRMVKEELEDMQQPCPDLHPKVKTLLIEPDFELFLQAIEFYIGMNGLNAEIPYTEKGFRNKREEQLGHEELFFVLRGDPADVKLIVKCLNLKKLRSYFLDSGDPAGGNTFVGYIQYGGDGRTYDFRASHGYRPPDNDEELEDGE